MIPKPYSDIDFLENTVKHIINQFKDAVSEEEKRVTKGKSEIPLIEAKERYNRARNLVALERDKHMGYLDSLMNKYKLPKKAKKDIIKEILRTSRTMKKNHGLDPYKTGFRKYIDELSPAKKKK